MSVSAGAQRKVASLTDSVLSQTSIRLSPSYSSPLLSFLPLPFFLYPPFLPFPPPVSQAWSEVSALQQGSLQETGSELGPLDEPERVPLCPSASGALSKFSNCCRRQGGGGGRRVCLCERRREPEKERRAEATGGIMGTSRVWAPLLLLPLTSLVSSIFL